MTKKKSAHDLFGTNKNLEAEKGVTLDYSVFQITILRAGGANKKYSKALNENMKPYRAAFERGDLDDETSEEILLKSFVQGVVLGWSGNIGRNGKKEEYSEEACIAVFKELPDLFDDVKKQANDKSLFRAANEAIEEKN